MLHRLLPFKQPPKQRKADTEEKDPLSLLTYDGWIHVLNRVEDPQDRWHAANAHPLFWSILTVDHNQEWMSTLLELVLPWVYKQLDTESFLKLRLVNKAVQSKIDRLVEERFQIIPQTYKNIPIPTFPLHYYLLDVYQDRFDLDTLLAEKRALPHAKLVGRSVVFLEPVPDMLDSRPFFREFGKDILHLMPLLNHDVRTPLESAELLRDILHCTSNLIKLHVTFQAGHEELWRPEEERLNQVERFWLDNPLPVLSHLQELMLRFPTRGQNQPALGGYVGSTIMAILHACAQNLTLLAIEHHQLLLVGSMPKLTTLKVEIRSQEDLASLEALNAPELFAIVLDIEEHCLLEPNQLFRVLQRSHSKVAGIEVCSQSWDFGRMDRFSEQVEFPCLIHLALRGRFNGSIGKHFRFLEKCKVLQTLHLAFECRPGGGENGLQEVNEQASINGTLLNDSRMPDDQFYKCSIWKCLPDLKTVHVEVKNIGEGTKTYDRETYDAMARVQSGIKPTLFRILRKMFCCGLSNKK